MADGSTLITATMSGVSGTAALTVAPPIGFVLTGSLNTKRTLPTATLLNDGTVLVAGGAGATGFTILASAETYSPTSGTFKATGNMNSARFRATATLLPNGMVLVAGGTNAAGAYLASAELYNPATGTFTLTGSMTTSRAGHTAVVLPNGTVLIVGGATVIPPATTPTFLTSAEIYNPATGTFAATGSITFPFGGTITLLNTGKVLVVGGTGATLSADLYDPATGTFTPTLGASNIPGGATATLLNNGMVLFTGGLSGGNATGSAELYNPAADGFTTTGSMITGRFNHTATLLSNGMVLVAAGYVGNNVNILIAIPSAELYDPATGTFTQTGSLNVARDDHTATLLNNGKLLVVGGDNANQSNNVSSGDALASAELYTPSTMTPPGLTSISVTPANPTVSVGTFQRFIATGTFSSGPAQTLASVTWSSSNTSVATITNDVGSKGFADNSPGTTTITATAGSISGSTLLTVVGPVTHFSVTAPGTAAAGTAFSVTVTALDALNAVVTGYTGTVHFTSSDGAAVLPANSTLTNGVGTFSATLKTTGAQTITATDTVTATITGSSGTITVGTATPITLQVKTAGTAFGTVTDNLGQINCTQQGGANPSGNCTTQYPSGTQVTLTATTPGTGGLRWRAHCVHGDGKYLPVYDYRYGNCDGDVYAGTGDVPADGGGRNSAYRRRNDHECAYRDQLHVDGNDDERNLHAEFPGRDTGDVDVCARAGVGFLRVDGDDADVLGEQQRKLLAEYVSGDDGDGGVYVGRGDGERHGDGRWKCDGHGERWGDQLHEYRGGNADGNLQRGLYAGSGSHFDRDAGCWRDFLRLDGSVVHESYGGDV